MRLDSGLAMSSGGIDTRHEDFHDHSHRLKTLLISEALEAVERVILKPIHNVNNSALQTTTAAENPSQKS